jgi:hypothetical protein
MRAADKGTQRFGLFPRESHRRDAQKRDQRHCSVKVYTSAVKTAAYFFPFSIRSFVRSATALLRLQRLEFEEEG